MLNGVKCVASATDAGQGGGKVEDRFQVLVLEIDTGNAPEGGVWFKVEFESTMEMGGIEEGVERVTMVFFEGNIYRQDRWGNY